MKCLTITAFQLLMLGVQIQSGRSAARPAMSAGPFGGMHHDGLHYRFRRD